MRVVLDGLYKVSGWLAAAFLLAIAVIVLLQVSANCVDVLAKWLLGSPFGLTVPSYSELAGFFLAASSFLALASAMRAGAHVRVELLLNRLGVQPRRWAEAWCAAAGTLIAGYFTWNAAALVRESFVYGDTSPGIVPVPLGFHSQRWQPGF
jgi:TRAP-type C4-dicarboxylate transport system permease small subunit